VELRGFEPLTFCMPCMRVSSDGVALRPVTALQSALVSGYVLSGRRNLGALGLGLVLAYRPLAHRRCDRRNGNHRRRDGSEGSQSTEDDWCLACQWIPSSLRASQTVLRGQRRSWRAISAVLVGFSTFGVSPLQRTEFADRAHACRCARRADGPRLFGPAGVIHPPAGRGDLL